MKLKLFSSQLITASYFPSAQTPIFCANEAASISSANEAARFSSTYEAAPIA
jgi:hypothetical protein